MAIGMMQVTKPPMGVGAPAPLPSGGIQGTATNYVQPGSQFSQQNIQRNAQQRVPFQGRYNGNPRGAANMPRMGNQNPYGFQGQGQAPAWSQQTNLGRYVPPTMSGMGGYNSNVWNNQGGYDYNLPGSYGSPLGQGQFAPMPRQFQQFQQYMQQMQYGGGGQGGFPGMGGQMDRMRQQQMMEYGAGSPYQGGMPGTGSFGPGQGGGMQVGDRFDPSRSMQEAVSQFDPRAINADPDGFRRWAQQAMNVPGQDPQYAAQIRAQLEQMGSAAPDKVGRLQAPQFNAWDNPNDRGYNMAALRQMMGSGYF